MVDWESQLRMTDLQIVIQERTARAFPERGQITEAASRRGKVKTKA